MKYSSEPSGVTSGFGALFAQEGKSWLSLGVCVHSCATWNVGCVFVVGGSLSLYEDDSGKACVTS